MNSTNKGTRTFTVETEHVYVKRWNVSAATQGEAVWKVEQQLEHDAQPEGVVCEGTVQDSYTGHWSVKAEAKLEWDRRGKTYKAIVGSYQLAVEPLQDEQRWRWTLIGPSGIVDSCVEQSLPKAQHEALSLAEINIGIELNAEPEQEEDQT